MYARPAPWLALRHGGIAFEEVMHALPELGGKPAFGAISPNARVPALDLGDGVVIADRKALRDHHPATEIERRHPCIG